MFPTASRYMVSIEVPMDHGARTPYVLPDLGVYNWMTEHPSAAVYGEAGVDGICHARPYRRVTFPMTAWEPELPRSSAVSFYYFPRSYDPLAPPLNECVQTAGEAAGDHSVLHYGDVVAVLHTMYTERMLHLKYEWATKVQAALLESVHPLPMTA